MVYLQLEEVVSQIEKLALEAVTIIEDEASFNMAEDKKLEIPITTILKYVETRLRQL